MLKEIVTSLEVSKKLKELGIKTETEFVFNQAVNGDDGTYYISFKNVQLAYYGGHIPAYTLEQILNLLPDYIQDNLKDYYELTVWQKAGISYFLNDCNMIKVTRQKDENLATTAARLLIKLHEGLLTDKGAK